MPFNGERSRIGPFNILWKVISVLCAANRVHNGGRIVHTSLHVPEDFSDDNFHRLLINALFWTAHRDPEHMKK